jgi:uncharacterized membrane protein
MVAAVLAAGVGAAAQQRTFSYATITFPQASFTVVMGVNPAGDIVGMYRDQSGKTRGFVRRREAFASVDYPDAVFTQVRGINAAGDVVGAYRLAGEPDANLHGFILNQQGRFTRVDVPGHTSTVAVRLLADSTIVGCFHDADATRGMYGMTLAGTKVSSIDRATSMHMGATPDGKTIVGFFTDTMATRGYVLEEGILTPFDAPGSTLTSAQDINGFGAIAGFYRDTGGKLHGFVREGVQYTTLDVPGANDTRAMGINADGSVVGSFVDAAGTTHGFVATRK